jgi:enoyl-CoA hydratase/carnithine racemase
MREIVITSPSKNAVSSSLLESLARDLEAAGGEPLLLSGAGDAFSAGLDLTEVARIDEPIARRLLGALEHLVAALYTYPAPTVALVNGHAIAGGCVLALCCDHRVATADPRVRIGLNEVALGLAFPPVTLAMVRARLTAPEAERVILGSQLLEPAAALAAGLVDEVAADARAVAVARLEALARHPRAAYARAKADLRGRALPAAGALDPELVARWASEDTRAAAARALRR